MHWMNDRRRALGVALVIGGILLLGLKAWQILATVRSLQSRMTQAQALAQSLNPKVDLGVAETLVMGARADVLSLRAEAGPFLGLIPHLGWLPGVGGDLQAAPALLDMADGLTEAGVVLWQGLSPLIQGMSGTSQQAGTVAMMPQALAQLNAARPQLEQAHGALARADAARAMIQVDRLSPKLAGQVRKLDDLLPLAQLGVGAALAAPDALGLNGSRTYLILAQNEDEIRPTGGFISAAGRVTFERGRLTDFSFMDANVVDDLTRPYPDLPDPLARYMGLGQMNELWLFRDSNWSPDFPTSARRAAEFYTYGQRVPVNGVMAVDQRAVQMLITALGPINVVISNTQTTITGDNIVNIMREAWNPPGGQVTKEWMMTRKGFIGQVAATVRARVENDPDRVPWTIVGRALLQAMDERHILVYMTQPDLAAALAPPGWDGAIRSTEGDYLMIVDASVGYGKANAVITQSMSYTVTLTRNGTGQATLSLNYRHSGKPGVSCQQELPYGSQVTYQSIVNRCFYDYLRVYVPPRAQLLDSTHQSIPASYFLSRQAVNSQAQMLGPEAGKSVLAMLFVVETGGSWQTRLNYQLPSSITQRVHNEQRYSLLIQKQPGKGTIPTVVTVNLPPGAEVTSTVSSNGQASVREGRVQFEFSMNKDTYIEVRYRD